VFRRQAAQKVCALSGVWPLAEGVDRERQAPRPVRVGNDRRRVDAVAPAEDVLQRHDQQIRARRIEGGEQRVAHPRRERLPGRHLRADRFDLGFEPRGESKIDTASIKVEYLKGPGVDLTERLKSGIKPAGIEIPAAAAPAGEHPIRVTVRDSEGRMGTAEFKLTVK